MVIPWFIISHIRIGMEQGIFYVLHLNVHLLLWLQVSNVKAADAAEEKEKIAANGKPRLQKPLEVVSLLKKEAVQSGQGEQKPPEENGVAGDVLKASKSVTEKHVVANGVANTC